MDEIITELTHRMNMFCNNSLTGHITLEIHFYRGGIANYLIGEKESKKIKKQTAK